MFARFVKLVVLMVAVGVFDSRVDAFPAEVRALRAKKKSGKGSTQDFHDCIPLDAPPLTEGTQGKGRTLEKRTMNKGGMTMSSKSGMKQGKGSTVAPVCTVNRCTIVLHSE